MRIFKVTQEVYDILSTRGYKLRCRGTVDVKGKGNMVTFFLDGIGETPQAGVRDIYAVSLIFITKFSNWRILS